MATTNFPRWSDIKKKLGDLDREGLIALVKDLHDASKTNQAFLAARLASSLEAAGALEGYRDRIVQAFFPRRGWNESVPRLGEARAVLREYKRARRDDINGMAELLLTYVETGTRFTNEYGDIDEPFYNSMESVLRELVTLLSTPAADMAYRRLHTRVYALRDETRDIGWGYADGVSDLLKNLREVREPDGTE